MDKFPANFPRPLDTGPPQQRLAGILFPLPVNTRGKGGGAMHWLWYFLIYSFLGFLIEVCYVHITGEARRERKCRLLLPICPVYGLGALGLLLLPAEIQQTPWLLFPAAVVICTGAEWLAGLFYEKVFRVCFWDYSYLPLHLGRHVCLRFALYWGVLTLLVYYLLHPWVVWLVMHIPLWLGPPMAALLAADTLLTAALLRRTRDIGALRWYLRLFPRKPA